MQQSEEKTFASFALISQPVSFHFFVVHASEA